MSERLTPHQSGNNGEAPVDNEPGWASRIEGLVVDMDEYLDGDSAIHSVTRIELDRIKECFLEIVEEIREYNKRWGSGL